ncbi:MAG: redoxin [Phycisphaerae bacterium]|nr:redoxin [Phycisphaerae bacterium]
MLVAVVVVLGLRISGGRAATSETAAALAERGGWGMVRSEPVDRAGRGVIGPRVLDARTPPLGRFVPPGEGRGLDGGAVSWRRGAGARGTIIAMTSVSCPVGAKLAPELGRICAEASQRGVGAVFVNVAGDPPEQIEAAARAAGLRGLHLIDGDHSIRRVLRAASTTEVFLIDGAGTLVYRGAMNDQYGLGYALDAPRRNYLREAIDDLLAGVPVRTAATTAPGCLLEPEPALPGGPGTQVTYHREIARIVAANCLECHRTGGVAPFALDSFDAVSRRATTMLREIERGTMPPWFAAPQPGQASDHWLNDRSLSVEDKAAFGAWVRAGKPQGDPAESPRPPRWPEVWSIGTPDVVFEMPRAVQVKAEGTMPYVHQVVRTGLTEDRWVQAVQVLPGDRSVVHHVLVFALTGPAADRGAESIDEARGFFAAYVPGNDSVVYPRGLAKKLPRNAALLFQVHYTPNGREASDRTRIGLVFASEPPVHAVRTSGIANRRIAIPPGAEHHAETATVTLPADMRVLSFVPHMHVRGSAFRYDATTPDGRALTLLDIPRYDFNWQLRYMLRDPAPLPAGTRLTATAWYDNSPNNPANPDPTRLVKWGPQTYDEMMLGYVEYYLEREDPDHPETLPDASGDAPRVRGAPRADRLLRLFDRNRDGEISRDECPPGLRAEFDRLDADRDGRLTRRELGG